MGVAIAIAFTPLASGQEKLVSSDLLELCKTKALDTNITTNMLAGPYSSTLNCPSDSTDTHSSCANACCAQTYFDRYIWLTGGDEEREVVCYEICDDGDVEVSDPASDDEGGTDTLTPPSSGSPTSPSPPVSEAHGLVIGARSASAAVLVVVAQCSCVFF